MAAAGRGERFGGALKKQFLMLAGAPVLIHALTLFQNASLVDDAICLVPKEDFSYAQALIERYSLTKVKTLLPGGGRRQDSVAAAVSRLEKTGRPDDIVLVHDGVRPLASSSLISKVVAGVESFGAAAAACPVTDSLSEVSEARWIRKSLSRDTIWAMQTPQGFRLSILAEAYRKAARDDFFATDEAMLVARLGVSIRCVEGSAENIKITKPSDLKMAEFLVRARDRSCDHDSSSGSSI